jgi:hypothetical protein
MNHIPYLAGIELILQSRQSRSLKIRAKSASSKRPQVDQPQIAQTRGKKNCAKLPIVNIVAKLWAW